MFGLAIEDFKRCHHLVLCIDDTHLCEKYAGRLLIAIDVDADGGLLHKLSPLLQFRMMQIGNNFHMYEFIQVVRAP